MANTYQQPPPPVAEEMPGLPESIRLMLASAASYLHSRLQLFGLEAKDAGINYVKIIVLLITALIALVFSYVFLVMAAVFAVAWLVHGNWGWVLFGFGFLHIAVAAGCALLAKSRFTTGSFDATIAEFKKDKEWLSQTKTASRSQTLSVVKTS